MSNERELYEQEVLGCALIAGFMLSTQYGQNTYMAMPVSDSSTLIAFADALKAKWQAARQDWPSEDEAVEIMLRAYLRHPDATLWKIPDRLRVAYRALLAATPKRQDWQPIETAPKDGTHILVWQPDTLLPDITVVAFDEDWCAGGMWMCCDGKNTELPLRGAEPTHWMPLPPAPKGGK